MKGKDILFLALLFSFFTLISCGDSDTKGKTDAEILDSLKTKYATIQDSIQSAWKQMIAEDDLKLNYLKRLVDEVTYTLDFDSAEVDALYQKIENARNLRYDQVNMADSDLINEYDFAINNLITEITSFAASHPRYEKFPLMEELINDIRQLDHNTLFQRMNYDDYAKEHNLFIEENIVLESEIEPEGFSRRPLFELSE